jgi:cysteine desulfurase/selenocysteine lyase
VSIEIAEVREEFPIFQRQINGKRLVYLDSAASAQKPRAVIEAIVDVYERCYANVHRGIYTLADEATMAYEEARVKIAQFINASDPAEVINVRNATEGLNLVAYAWGETHLQPGDRVIVTELEHHSNLVPWQQLAKRKGLELAYLPITGDGRLMLKALTPLLDDGRAKLVACTLMSNVFGTIPDVSQVVEAAHAAGALVVLDGAQAVPHIPVDVQALDADFMAFSGHKMGGPGAGILWGRREILATMHPFLYGGDMILHVEKHQSTWNELPYKFEAGTPSVAEVVGLGAAVDFLSDLGMDTVHQHEVAIVTHAITRLSEVPGLRIYGPSPTRRGGVVPFTLEGIHPHDIASILDEEGICIRAGLHCAEPLHTRFSLRATARASFYIYNDEEDVEALVKGLHKVRQVLGH